MAASGYPRGLGCEDNPLGAYILAADAFDLGQSADWCHTLNRHTALLVRERVHTMCR